MVLQQLTADTTINNTLSWAGIGLISVLSSLGVGAILLFTVKFFLTWWKEGKTGEHTLNVENEGKSLDNNARLITELIAQVDRQGEEIKELQSHYTEMAVTNERLKTQTEHKDETIHRLGDEIDKLRRDRRDSDQLIATLQAELNALKLVVIKNAEKLGIATIPLATTPEKPLDVRIVGNEIHLTEDPDRPKPGEKGSP